MRLTVELPPEESSLVNEALRSGDFPDATAMMVAALQVMKDSREDLLGYSIDELRALGDDGEASGPGLEADFDEIKREARRRASIPGAEA